MTTNRAEPKQSSHRVLVMSDTHLVDAARLPSALLELAMVADHIVHAGDVSTLDVISVLAGCAPLTAVRGNVESPETWQRLPDRATVTVAASCDRGRARCWSGFGSAQFATSDIS